MSLFKINDFTRLRQYSHIIWDIDRTITDEDGALSEPVAAKIINLALTERTYHTFITGRDASWIETKVISRLTPFYKFHDVRNYLSFYGEVGCVIQQVDEVGQVSHRFDKEIEDHPLKTNRDGIRNTLRQLVYDPAQLIRYEGGKLQGSQEVIYDANEVGWVMDPSMHQPPRCRPYIWATTKEAFATFEKIRDAYGHFADFDQEQYADIIRQTITSAGFQDHLDIEVIGTAINIVPKVNGLKLGKSWAAGKALLHLREKLGETEIALEQVIAGTISAGDGRADLDFTRPTFPDDISRKLDLQRRKLDIIFVGGKLDLPKDSDPDANLKRNIIIQATGAGTLTVDAIAKSISWQDATGARVISEVLDYLKTWNHFRPFM